LQTTQFGVRLCINSVYKQIKNPEVLYKADRAHDTLGRESGWVAFINVMIQNPGAGV